MKKILFLLLLTVSMYGQTYQNPTYGTVTTKTNTESATATKINAQESDGKINWLQPINIPLTTIPVNYIPTSLTLGGNLAGIDNKLGTIVATTAGVTTRVWFTADVTVVSATNYYASNATSKGTSPSAIQNVINDDNQKKYFAQDIIGVPFATATIFPVGIYAGNLSASTTPNSAQQRWTVELYKCNNAGTPIASGITGAPVGSLGVTVVTILDSGLLTLADGSVTNVQVSGNLASPLSMAVGERIRYHVSAEKVGTTASNITQSVYYGTSYNSYLDVPVPLNTTAVQNLSTVSGATTTDALNTLKTGQDSKLNKTYESNYSVADNSSTIVTTTFDAFGLLLQTLSNKIMYIYRTASGHASDDGKIVVRSSTDGGKTFGALSIILQESGFDLRNVGGGVTPSGRIVIGYTRLQSGLTLNMYYIYSDDDGLTWSTPALLSPLTHTVFSTYGNMINIADGKLALPWYGVTGGLTNTYLKFSTDNGATWGGDILVGTGNPNGFNEATYAYLDGGVILCVARTFSTNTLNQFISTDNGATWTNQGSIPYVNAGNVSPWLNVYIESNGEKYVTLSFAARTGPKELVCISASKSSVIAGTSGWLAETKSVIFTGAPTTDFGYPSLINPRFGKKMLGVAYRSNGEYSDPTAVANLTFFNYTPNAVVPAMNVTTNYIPKKTGASSLSNSRIFDDGTNIGVDTSTPNYNLHINSPSANSIIQLTNTFTGSTTNDGFLTVVGATGWVQFLNRENTPFQWYTNNTEKMRLHASGGLSLGNTTDPGATNLSVTGNINATSYTGTATLTGNPTAPTPTAGDNDTSIATTAFVNGLISSGTYTPVASASVNVSTTGISLARWIKIGTTYTVKATFSYTSATTAGITSSVTVNLPFNRATSGTINFGSGSVMDAAGNLFPVTVTSNATGTMIFNFKPTSTSGASGSVMIMYDTTE